jgi:hypothetical protein
MKSYVVYISDGEGIFLMVEEPTLRRAKLWGRYWLSRVESLEACSVHIRGPREEHWIKKGKGRYYRERTRSRK